MTRELQIPGFRPCWKKHRWPLACAGDASECPAAIEENEDHGRTSQGDQRKGTEIGDQMEVDAHGD